MVLYHITTTYHLLCAMVFSRKEKEKTVALCSTWIREKFPQADKLKQFFDDIIFADFNYRFFHNDKKNARYFIGLIGDPKQYTRIYAWGVQFSFGFFLNYRHIPYIYCEEAAGMISRPYVLRNIEKNILIKSKFVKQCEAYGAYDGSGDNVQKKMCNISAQEKGFNVDEKFIDFNVISELQALSTRDREKILSFFNPPRGLRIQENATLLLTQHFTNLGITSFEGQVLLYQTAVDYFFSEDTLVIKPHPDDLMYYSQLFPDAQIIRERFPSEFMPFIFDSQPNCVATISSTAIYNLRGHYPKVFELDTRYERDYPMTHRYYAAIKIAQKIGYDIVCYHSNEVLAQRLCETLDGDVPNITSRIVTDKTPRMILIDDVTDLREKGRKNVLRLLLNMDETSVAVMINSQSDYSWYDYDHRDIWNNMAPLVLTKTLHNPRNDDFYASEEEEILFIYSKNRELLKMAKEIDIVKDLPHTGITVKSAKLDTQEERIKMLEGILAATEKRLLYYIEKEKQAK